MYHEKLLVSAAMKSCAGESKEKALVLEYPSKKQKTSLKTILLSNFDLFFQYLMKQRLIVKSHEDIRSLSQSNNLDIILPTTCFKVNFNDSFVTITPIKKGR